MIIYLIRHSMTKGNKEKRYIGTTDEPLCEEGIRLLKERKGCYPETEHIYVSPMRRCVQTAEIIYTASGTDKKADIGITYNEKLKECDFGEFENKNYKELSGSPKYQAWIDSLGELPFPGGESKEQFRRRTLEGFREVVRDAYRNGWNTITIVAHGGTIMSIMEKYARNEEGMSAGSYYDYQVKNGEGYELRISENAIYDGGSDRRFPSGSDLRRSEMAVSSGQADRSTDRKMRKNYQKLPARE